MFLLVGTVCFMSLTNCTPSAVIGQPIPTMAECVEAKRKIDTLVKPVAWLDTKLSCVEEDWM